MGIGLPEAAGIGQGLMQGVQVYLQTQNMLEEQAIKKKLANAQTVDAVSKIWDVSGNNPKTNEMIQGLLQNGQFKQESLQTPGLLQSPSQPQSSVPQAPLPAQQQPVQVPQVAPQVPQPGASPNPLPSPSSTPQSGGLMKSPGNEMSYSPESGGYLPGRGKLQPLTYYPKNERAGMLSLYNEQASPKEKEELRNLKYSGRSANSEIGSQYDKHPAVETARKSQVAMQQMIDNYNNPSPQGDASLILNAFKIKFPSAPDVNSLHELSNSQSAPDTWKNFANKSINGTFDDDTRKNLLRDGISTYRGNIRSLEGAQQKAIARLKQAGIDDPTVTMEPSIDSTWKEAKALQKQIGPYVKTTDRPGGLAAAVLPAGAADTVNKMGSGLMSFAKGLMPGPSASANESATSSISDSERKLLLQTLKNNPKDPRASSIKTILGM